MQAQQRVIKPAATSMLIVSRSHFSGNNWFLPFSTGNKQTIHSRGMRILLNGRSRHSERQVGGLGEESERSESD